MARRVVTIVIFFGIVIIALWLIFGRKERQSNQIPMQKKIEHLKMQLPSSPKINKNRTQVVLEKFCEEEVLAKIAARCDEHCLFAHLQKKDPELIVIIRELRVQPKKIKTRLAKFTHAFYSIEADPKERERYLRELTQEDKDNAYPAFFLAAHIPDDRESEKRALIEEALKRKNYESYSIDFFRRLKRATIDRPDIYARALMVNTSLSGQLNVSILWEIGEFDSELAKRVALRILKPTIEANGDFADILWGREDYLMADQMLRVADPTEHALLPEFDIGNVLEKNAPGLSEECSARAFFNEMENERIRLHQVK